MNWYLIAGIVIVGVIVTPIIYLFYKAIKSGEFNGGSLERIEAIKQLETIDSMRPKDKD